MSRVFIIDDDKMFLQTVEKILLRLGYEVDTCNDSTKAVELVKAGNYDLILTDLQMPGKNGIDVAKEIISFGMDLEVLLITGYATLDAALQAMKIGIYDIILKPASLEQIQSSVGRAIEKLRLERENRDLLEALRLRDENVQLLQAIGEYIKKSPTFDEILFFIGETLEAQMGISEYSLFGLDKNSGTYNRILSHHTIDPLNGKNNLKISKQDLEKIFSYSRPYMVSSNSENFSESNLFLPRDIEDASIVLVPLISYSQLVGFILLNISESGKLDIKELVNLLDLFSNLISHTFYSRELQEDSENSEIIPRIKKILMTNLKKKKQADDNYSFCTLYFGCPDLSSFIKLLEFDDTIKELIFRNFGRNAMIHTLTPNFYMIVIPYADYQSLEIKSNKFASGLNRFLEDQELSTIKASIALKSSEDLSKNQDGRIGGLI